MRNEYQNCTNMRVRARAEKKWQFVYVLCRSGHQHKICKFRGSNLIVIKTHHTLSLYRHPFNPSKFPFHSSHLFSYTLPFPIAIAAKKSLINILIHIVIVDDFFCVKIIFCSVRPHGLDTCVNVNMDFFKCVQSPTVDSLSISILSSFGILLLFFFTFYDHVFCDTMHIWSLVDWTTGIPQWTII